MDHSQFVDLASFEDIQTKKRPTDGNILKGDSVVSGVAKRIEPVGGDDHLPKVLVHKAGDIVQSIEFVCTCGNGTVVTLEYDGDKSANV